MRHVLNFVSRLYLRFYTLDRAALGSRSSVWTEGGGEGVNQMSE